MTQQSPENDISQDSLTPSNGINWYAKLHPTGVVGTTDPANGTIDKAAIDKSKVSKRSLNLSLFFRIWMAVAIVIIVSGLIVFTQLFNYVRPVTQQVIEDTLVDTAKLLATSLQTPLETGQIYDEDYQAVLDSAFRDSEFDENVLDITAINQSKNMASTKHYENRQELERLSTWYHQKTHSSFRVYVTDSQGIVIYDSQRIDNDEGADYSRWNDVRNTLNGEYGARTSRRNEDNPESSVMYIAQPIYSSTPVNDATLYNVTSRNATSNVMQNSNTIDQVTSRQLIGVVSVGKPTSTILPYLKATRQRMLMTSVIISLVALFFAGLIAWWLKQSIMMVSRYTQSLAQDANKPYFYLGQELNELSDTIETMKHKLENRAYVTDYVHTLTHELKSPLTAIRASGELLEDNTLDNEDRVMLSQTITEQSIKMQALIDRLLLLAKIEQPTFRLVLDPIDLKALLKTLIRDNESKRLQTNVSFRLHTEHQINETNKDNELNQTKFIVRADRFWLTQALQNIIDNALYFAHSQVDISISVLPTYFEIAIYNDGDLIPDYALDKIFDRYFSLSHNVNASAQPLNTTPRTSKKGTGLGLTLVKQVIERHQGTVYIQNINADEPETVHDKVTEPISESHSAKELDKPLFDSGVLVTIRLPKNIQTKSL